MAEETKPSDGLTPLAKAAERIRGSAQWLLGAFAAVGALLAAGLQIASIGDLDTDDGWRFWVAFAGIAIAVIGIVVAVAAAATVSTKSEVSLPWLVQNCNSEAAKMVQADSALRQGLSTPELRERLDATATAAGSTFEQIVQLGDPGNDPDKKQKAAELREAYTQQTAELDRLLRIRTNVLDVASFYRVKEAFDDAKARMVGGALAAALGITAFAWGANAPESTSLDGGDVLPKTPSEVTVILSDRGVETFGDAIRKNDDCDLSNLAAVAFAVNRRSYDVVTVATDDCNVFRMNVTRAAGQVIPRVKAASQETSEATTTEGG